jgi:RNA polymerase sigma-70 factor (ECF subfamily)
MKTSWAFDWPNKSALRGIFSSRQHCTGRLEVCILKGIATILSGDDAELEEAADLQRFLSTPSEESFGAVFARLAQRLLGYFRVRGCSRELSEDLAQEVLLAVYRSASRLRDKDQFWPWFYRIAANVLHRQARDVSRRVTTVACNRETAELSGPEDDPLLAFQFAEWMAWLSPEDQQIMTLRYVEGLEYHEIATIVGSPLGTVQWRIFEAKRRLAARFRVGASKR